MGDASALSNIDKACNLTTTDKDYINCDRTTLNMKKLIGSSISGSGSRRRNL